MHVIPFPVSPDTFNVFIALLDTNIERIKAYDPAQLDVTKLPEEFQKLKLGIVIIGYMNDEDVAEVHRLMSAKAFDAALSYLSRGFKFSPEKGDHDGKYN